MSKIFTFLVIITIITTTNQTQLSDSETNSEASEAEYRFLKPLVTSSLRTFLATSVSSSTVLFPSCVVSVGTTNVPRICVSDSRKRRHLWSSKEKLPFLEVDSSKDQSELFSSIHKFEDPRNPRNLGIGIFEVIVRDTWTSVSPEVVDSLVVSTTTTTTIVTTITFTTTSFNSVEVAKIADIPNGVQQC